MQVSTKLREPFSLSVTPFIVLVIILVILIILYVILKNYKPRVKNPNIIIRLCIQLHEQNQLMINIVLIT